MQFRKANLSDLQEIKTVYRAIVADMDKNGVSIWDEVYPCDFFEQDILNGNLYALFDDKGRFVSAFALLNEDGGNSKVAWKYNAKAPLYMYRLGVNPQNARQGIGKAMIKNAIRTAKELGADSLRLLVSDINIPAIALYEKMDFIKADGTYFDNIVENQVLREFGYEYVLE